MNHFRRLIIALAGVAVVALTICVAAPRLAAAQQNSSTADSSAAAGSPVVPRLIKFSGTLLDQQGEPMKSPAGVTFALYAQQSGGAALWMDLAARANGYIQETVPWELAKAGKAAELDAVLATLARTVARLAVLGQPFLPATAETVWALFGSPPPRPLAGVRLAELGELDVAGQQVQKAPILFPKPRLAA